MSAKSIQDLISEYYESSRQVTRIREKDDGLAIVTTPFLDNHNDRFQIYVKCVGEGEFELTDDGFVLNDLEMSGCPMNSPARRELLTVALNGFSVEEVNGDLKVRASESDFKYKFHDLIQAMIAVNGMHILAQPIVERVFKEDVFDWLLSCGIEAKRDVKMYGKTGFTHKIDFVIPQSEGTKNAVLQTVKRPLKQDVKLAIMSVSDVLSESTNKPAAFMLLNDDAGTFTDRHVRAIENYGITPFLWSQRSEFSDRLAG